MIKFIKQLFCKHEYIEVSEARFRDAENTKYIGFANLYKCEKCNKVIKEEFWE